MVSFLTHFSTSVASICLLVMITSPHHSFTISTLATFHSLPPHALYSYRFSDLSYSINMFRYFCLSNFPHVEYLSFLIYHIFTSLTPSLVSYIFIDQFTIASFSSSYTFLLVEIIKKSFYSNRAWKQSCSY